MSLTFARFLIENRLGAFYHNIVWKASVGHNALQRGNIVALDAINIGNINRFDLNEIYDGILFHQRNSKVPTKANHGARPCSHVSRRIKVQEKWFGPRWYRKKVKKEFRNSENKIHP